MKKTFFILFSLAFFAACKKKNVTQNTAAMATVTPDFRAFYESFHSDTAFQRKHIQFPLQGLPQDVDSATVADQDYFYTEDAWVWHLPVDFSKGEFTQEIRPLTDRMIIERIYKSDNTYAVERRFAKLSDEEWYLIYYIAPNHFSSAK